jgi:hypothetical protein
MPETIHQSHANYLSETAKFGWDFKPPEHISPEDAIKIFVEGMECAVKSHEQAIQEAFKKNLHSVLGISEKLFNNLQINKHPVSHMLVKAFSINSFRSLLGIETSFFTSDAMLLVYKETDLIVKKFCGENKNIQWRASYMSITGASQPNFEILYSDGYMFRYVGK